MTFPPIPAFADQPCTVPVVLTAVSQPVPGGHLVLFDAPAGTRVVASFVDQPDETRDVTGWFADLVLLGLGARDEAAREGSPAPAEEVTVAQVSLDGDDDAVRVFYVHHPSGTATPVDVADALQACALGVARQITAGVAHDEAADALAGDVTPAEVSDAGFGDLPPAAPEDPPTLPPGA